MATLKRSLFIATLDSLDTPHYLSPAIGHAAAATTDSLVVILLSPLFDLQVPVPPISRTERWDDIQRILAHVYVQATKVAQDNGRILMDVNVLLRGCEQPLRADLATEAEMCFLVEGENNIPSLPLSIRNLPQTTLPTGDRVSTPLSTNALENHEQDITPRLYPVVALGGTFDHLHAGHKILLSMAAWITEKKLIVGLTDEVLLQRKSYRDLLEPFHTRVEKTRSFLQMFRQDLEYDLVAISDVYGPTGWDPNIQALVVSKETLPGATAIAKERARKGLPALETFVIDVISADSDKLDHEDAELLRQTKMSSTYIREWISKNHSAR
ncbi:hypothetical protein SCLCIDRAFT_1212514 [Scleroderma citrinum Foug A]|uniref:Cytidyltransferase-like domain-containing protein n=1 Tax=Scleroderma citrinum Foug A TaxID=1036808 RepID=A0A0C3DXQ5_9AGAM|nr:hypothetical protein SCLCIDRAFT_1212514 [Scleroderma citrinum Foug A]